MIVVNDRFCPQNHRCPAVVYCPQGAIVQADIYSAPRVDHELCTECGAARRSAAPSPSSPTTWSWERR
jgi:ferredoxin